MKDVTGSRARAFSTVFYHLLVWAAAVSPRVRFWRMDAEAPSGRGQKGSGERPRGGREGLQGGVKPSDAGCWSPRIHPGGVQIGGSCPQDSGSVGRKNDPDGQRTGAGQKSGLFLYS